MKSPKHRNTKFVDQHVDEIERALEQVEREIKSDETTKARFRRAVWEYLDPPERVGRYGTRGRVTFYFDHVRSLEDFEIASGRAVPRELIVQLPVLSTIVPTSHSRFDRAVEVRDVLEFKQGATTKDRLQYHPLVFESPFSAKHRIVLECRVSSPTPVFFGISLAGACVGMLSQDEIVEGGRGVAFWMGGLADVDRRAVFQPLRTTTVRAAIDGKRNADERRRLEDTKYFRMRANRSYRIRYEKGTREAVLHVDGREIGRWAVDGGSLPDRRRIMILAFTTTRIDELRIEGIVDPRWEKKR